MDISNYQTKPTPIKSILWDGSTAQAGEIISWVAEHGGVASFREVNETAHRTHSEIRVRCRDGFFAMSPGWWIVMESYGNFDIYRPESFDSKYDKIE